MLNLSFAGELIRLTGEAPFFRLFAWLPADVGENQRMPGSPTAQGKNELKRTECHTLRLPALSF
jgi:hypothetical protein